MSTFAVLRKLNHNIIDQKEGFLNNNYVSDDFSIQRSINSKFRDDKIFEKDSEILISIDGYVLNKKELINDYAGSDFFSVLKELYKKKGHDFIKELRGDFSLFLYDFDKKKLFVSTNITSSKPVYYFSSEDLIIASTNPLLIKKYLDTQKIPYTFNISGAYNILILNYMIGNKTLVNEINKLLPGQYLSISDKNLTIDYYYKLTNLPDIESPKSKILETLDELFSYAVKLEYEKDKEYGYDHLVTLSGGLDSRMNLLYADRMGYKKMTALNFGVKNYWDHSIAKKIARDKKIKFIFNNLKNGEYLKNTDPLLNHLALTGKFFGPAHSYFTFSKINWNNFGLIHTGQIGDAIVGVSLSGKKEKSEPFSFSELKFDSKTLEEKIKVPTDVTYPNLEIANILNRGFNSALDGNIIAQDFSEMISPFLFQDFMDYSLRIPFSLKKNNALYYEWIKEKLPEAGTYFYQQKRDYTIQKKRSGIDALIKKGVQLKYKVLNKFWYTYSMNPYTKWLNKKDLSQYFNSYFYDNIDIIEDSELRTDCINLFESESGLNKLSAVSLIKSVKTFRNKTYGKDS